MNQHEFEASLKLGDKVRLRWRGKFVPAKVSKISKSSLAVVIDEPVGEYKKGATVKVNRASSGRWSASNCVRPLE